MTSQDEDLSKTQKYDPPFGAIIGSILGIVGWLVFILLYALYWSKGFDLFQNIILTIASLLITGMLIGAVWMIWFRLAGEPRHWWAKTKN
jgi:H+/Cl- antiporter ClcA